MKKNVIKTAKVNGMRIRLTRYKHDRAYRLIMVNTANSYRFELEPGKRREKKFVTKRDGLLAFEEVVRRIPTMKNADRYHPTMEEVLYGFSTGCYRRPKIQPKTSFKIQPALS